MTFNNILLQPLFLLLVLLISACTTFTSAVSIGLSSATSILARTFHKRQGHTLDPNNDGLEVKVVFIRDLSEGADNGCYFNSFGHKICHLTKRSIEPLEDEQAEEEEEETEIGEAGIVKHRPALYWSMRQVSAPLIRKRNLLTTTTTTSEDDRLKWRQRPVEALNRKRRMSVPSYRDMYFVQRRRDVLTFMPDELENESEVEEEQEEDEDEEEDYDKEYEEEDEEEEEDYYE